MSTETSALEFAVTPASHVMAPEQRERLLADPGFGRIFTDHMVRIDWTRDRGWHNARLTGYAPLQLDPGVMVLHYAQAVFVGLKAFTHADGRIAAYSPHANVARFRWSARRLARPVVHVGRTIS